LKDCFSDSGLQSIHIRATLEGLTSRRDRQEPTNVQKTGGVASQGGRNLASHCTEKSLFVLGLEMRLGRGARWSTLQPLIHPAVNGFSPRFGHPVFPWRDKLGDLFSGAENLINPLDFPECFPGPRDREEILGGGANQEGLWSERNNEIAVVEPVLELAGKLLLRVLRASSLELVFPIRDIASTCRRLNAWVEGGQVGRQGPSTRIDTRFSTILTPTLKSVKKSGASTHKWCRISLAHDLPVPRLAGMPRF
jgi:hypothetical protein